ncbi:MAG: protein kinase [Polyangiaceae bacterium]|nr:protein kinase [Polyangiaceae bacterium]
MRNATIEVRPVNASNADQSDLAAVWRGAFVVDGRYTVTAELGRGAMGVVYLARDDGLDREVALKMVTRERAKEPEIAARLQQEARALARVRSPHVVQVYAFGRHRNGFYFVMERVVGRSLAAIVDEHAALDMYLPVEHVLSLVTQVAGGLDAVHAVGLVHRDVKSDNILIEDDTGRPVLVDFGLAAGAALGQELGGGTPGYMAPEQALGAEVTERADVYALGCTVYEMLAGHTPFLGRSTTEIIKMHLTEPVPPIGSIRKQHAIFDPILTRALAKKPTDRYATCGALAADLNAAWHLANSPRRGLNSVIRSATPPPPPSPTVTPTHVPQATLPTLPKAPEQNELHILIVDEDPATLKLATRAAQIAFYRQRIRVSAVSTGLLALKKAQESPPSLILLGYELTGLAGTEVLSAVRDASWGQGARAVVWASALGLRASQFRFALMGVKHFLPRPVSLQLLVDAVREIGEQAGWHAPPETFDDDEDDEDVDE